MEKPYVSAQLGERARRLDPKQSAAYHRYAGPQRHILKSAHIVEIAEGENTRKGVARQAQAVGPGAGRQHEPVVAECESAIAEHRSAAARALSSPDASTPPERRHAPFGEPSAGREFDIGVLRVARQYSSKAAPNCRADAVPSLRSRSRSGRDTAR